MKPVYFPYTYIADPVAEAVAACLGQFTIYRPLADGLPSSMQMWVDNDIIEIRVPVADDGEALKAVVESYWQWARLHTGKTRALRTSLKTFTSAGADLDASLSSQIAADVKERIDASAGEKPSDPVLSSRIFLYFAELFDQQSREVDRAMMESIQKEQDLIRDLKVEEDDLAAEFKTHREAGQNVNSGYLISDRLEAWTRMMLKDSRSPSLFVTHSAGVLEQLRDRVPAVEKIADLATIAHSSAAPGMGHSQLKSYLDDIASNKWTEACAERAVDISIPGTGDSTAFQIYLAPGQNCLQFFSRAAGIEDAGADPGQADTQSMNTLIALVDA